MKKKLLMIWMIVAATGLSGCGSANEPDAQAQGAAQETVTAGEQTESTGGTDETDEYADFYIADPNVSLDELYAANDLRELAKNHESLSYTLESYDAQDHLESTVKGQFTFRDGRILFDSEMASLEESISYITCDELDGVTGAEYSYYPPDSDSSCYLTIYPADEYADIMAGRWMSNEKGLERKEELFATDVMGQLNIKPARRRTGRFCCSRARPLPTSRNTMRRSIMCSRRQTCFFIRRMCGILRKERSCRWIVTAPCMMSRMKMRVRR